jgi:hypothetical protein
MFGFLLGVALGAGGYWAWQSFGRDLLGMGPDQSETTYGGYSSSTSGGTTGTGSTYGSGSTGTSYGGTSSGTSTSGTSGTDTATTAGSRLNTESNPTPGV